MFSKSETGICPVHKSKCSISIHLHPVVSNEGDDYYIKGNFLCLHRKYGGKCRLGDSCPIHVSAPCACLM